MTPLHAIAMRAHERAKSCTKTDTEYKQVLAYFLKVMKATEDQLKDTNKPQGGAEEV